MEGARWQDDGDPSGRPGADAPADGRPGGRADAASRWAAEQGPAVVGLPLAEARARAEAAGLRTKTVPPSGITTLEFGFDRVLLHVDEGDRVTAVDAG